MSGELKVNFGGLDTAAADIQSGAGQIESRLDRLESDLAPLRSDWTGAASESYQVAKQKWTQAMTDMRMLLAEIGTSVSTSNSDYQQTEHSNQARWGN